MAKGILREKVRGVNLVVELKMVFVVVGLSIGVNRHG